MKALIVDDERLARGALRRLLKAHPYVEILGEAGNSDEALRAIRKFCPDLLFLDVEMPGCNGFELLEKLDDVPVVVFTTAYDEYAVRAFEISALDYLVKPIAPDRLGASLARVQKALATLSQESAVNAPGGSALHQVFVRDGDRCWIVRLTDIVLMESVGNYTRLHFGDNAPLIYRSLAAIEERLSPTVFFRTSRFQIINLRCIENVENEMEGRLVVKLSNRTRVEISRRQSRRLRELLSL